MTPTHDWNRAEPASLPKPTYAPAVFALGNVLLVWGPLTTWVISAVGLALSVAALAVWIGAIVREHVDEGGNAHD